METDEFLRRCEDLARGLHKLADDLYAAVEGDITGDAKDEVVSHSRQKVEGYEAFIAELDDDDDVEEAEGRLGDYMQRLKRNLQRLEAA